MGALTLATQVARLLPESAVSVEGERVRVRSAGGSELVFDGELTVVRHVVIDERDLADLADPAGWLASAMGPGTAVVHAPSLAPHVRCQDAPRVDDSRFYFGFVAPPGQPVIWGSLPDRPPWVRWEMPAVGPARPPDSVASFTDFFDVSWEAPVETGGVVRWRRPDNGAKCWLAGLSLGGPIMAAVEVSDIALRGVTEVGRLAGYAFDPRPALLSAGTALEEILDLAAAGPGAPMWDQHGLLDGLGRYWLRDSRS